MQFDVYGKFQLEVRCENDCWVMYKLVNGRMHPFRDFVIPALLEENELATFLDDMLHEWAGHGAAIRRIE